MEELRAALDAAAGREPEPPAEEEDADSVPPSSSEPDEGTASSDAGSGGGDDDEVAPSAIALLSLDLLDRVLSFVTCGRALACAACASRTLRDRAEDGSLWRGLVAAQWGWLVGTERQPEGCPWRELFVRLHTRRHARFCVVGGLPADAPDRDGGALQLSLCRTQQVQADDAAPAQQMGTHGAPERYGCDGDEGAQGPPLLKVRTRLGADELVLTRGLPPSPDEAPTLADLHRRQAEAAQKAGSVPTWRWGRLPPMSEERNMAAVVREPSGSLLAIGGLPVNPQHAALTTGERLRLDLPRPAWAPIAPMQQERCCASAAVDTRGLVWVVGGGRSMYANSPAWNSAERYDPAADSWRGAPDMTAARCALGVACSLTTGRLFAAGGYGGVSSSGGGSYLRSAEFIDVTSAFGEWTPLP